MTAYLFPALTAALAALVIVWVHWDWRTGKRRHEYRLTVITWRVRTLPYRLDGGLHSTDERAVSHAEEEGPRSPTPAAGGSVDQEPGMGARTPAPPYLTAVSS